MACDWCRVFYCVLIGLAKFKLSIPKGNLNSWDALEEVPRVTPPATPFRRDSMYNPLQLPFRRSYVQLRCKPLLEELVQNLSTISFRGGCAQLLQCPSNLDFKTYI